MTAPRNPPPGTVKVDLNRAPTAEPSTDTPPSDADKCGRCDGQSFSRYQSLKPDRESCGTWPPGSAAAVTPPPVPEAGDEYPPIDGPEERAFCAALIGAHLKVEQISEVLTIYRGVMAGEIATPEGWMPTASLPVDRPDSDLANRLRAWAPIHPVAAGRSVMREAADWIDAQPVRCPHVVGHPDSTQHCALNGPDLTELRAVRNSTEPSAAMFHLQLLAAVDRLLSEGVE